MANPYVDRQPSFEQFAQRRVFRCRIAVHLQGVQIPDTPSVNHLAFYLLIGEKQSVRFDMRPDGDDLGLGRLHLTGHDYTKTDEVFAHIDLNVAGCPPDFDEDTGSKSWSKPTADLFVGLIMSRRLERYRYLYVAGASCGCAHWIENVICLFASVRLITATQAQLSNVQNMLNTRYDRRYAPLKLLPVPGLFRCITTPDGSPTLESVADRLRDASDEMINNMAKSLMIRDRRLWDTAESILKLRAQRRHHETPELITFMARRAMENPRNAVIAIDLAKATRVEVERLYSVLVGNENLAFAAHMIGQMLASGVRDSRYLLALMAIIRMG